MIRVCPDLEALSLAAAELFAAEARQAVQVRGRFIVALAGGNTPQRTYELLAQESFRGRFPGRTYIFFGETNDAFLPTIHAIMPGWQARLCSTMYLSLLNKSIPWSATVLPTMPHLELAQHPVHNGKSYNEFIGNKALKKIGKKKWNDRVQHALTLLQALFHPDETYIGGGNARKINFSLGAHVQLISNQDGILGGFRLWEPIRKMNSRAKYAGREPVLWP